VREAAGRVYHTWRKELERRVEAEKHRIPVKTDLVSLFLQKSYTVLEKLRTKSYSLLYQF